MDLKITATFIEPDGSISGYLSNNQTNTSRLEKLAVPSLGEKLFYLSESENNITSPLDGEHLWADETIGYSGWVSNTYSNYDGTFSKGEEPSIILTGDIQKFVIYSDLIEEHFIEIVEIDGLLYNGSNEKLVVVLPERKSSVTIKVLKINVPYQPVKVTGIELGLDLVFENNEIVDYNFASQSQSNADVIEYSVISRYGSISIYNNDNLFNNLNDLDLLENNVVANVYINDKKFGEYILKNGNLNYGDTAISFELNDELIDIDQLIWNKAYYMEKDVSAKQFLDFIFNFISKEYKVYDTLTETILNNTILGSTIIEVDNIKQVLSAICEITQCAIFKNNNGDITIKYLESIKSEVN